MYIKSKDNDKFKLTKSLLTTKYRNKEGKYIAEGQRTIELAIEYGASIEFVFVNERFYNDPSKGVLIASLKESTHVYILDDSLFRQVVTTENSQGILAVINKKKMDSEDFNKNKHKKIIVVDRIQDPGNMGTIIRTADAAGFDLIICIKGTVDYYNPKVVRSAMGSMFYMDMMSLDNEEARDLLKVNDIDIVSSYLDTENYYDKVDYNENTALVVGNEANGISDFWIGQSDVLVKIPMFGKAESLNVAVSSALLMYKILGR